MSPNSVLFGAFIDRGRLNTGYWEVLSSSSVWACSVLSGTAAAALPPHSHGIFQSCGSVTARALTHTWAASGPLLRQLLLQLEKWPQYPGTQARPPPSGAQLGEQMPSRTLCLLAFLTSAKWCSRAIVPTHIPASDHGSLLWDHLLHTSQGLLTASLGNHHPSGLPTPVPTFKTHVTGPSRTQRRTHVLGVTY